ncbi:MAG: NAD(P)-dependent oxidoreductase, partial [Oscillospiraceae bacterium]
REIPRYSNLMRQGGWKTPEYYNQGLLDQKIGLVGFGEIPKYLVGMLKPFRVKIMAFDKYVSKEKMAEYGVQKVELEQIFSQCPIISLHLPKTEDTYHMIDEQIIKRIPDGALLINTARGSVIDEEYLTKELATNRFKAVLDVFEQEPPLENSPLRSMENAILIPHMGGPTIDRRKYATLAVLEDIKRFYQDEPLIHEISLSHANMMTK